MRDISHYEYVVICHLFYQEEAENLLDRLSAFQQFNTLYTFNVATPSEKETIAQILKRYPAPLIFTTPKKGRDISAKLFIINALLQLNISAEFAFIVHDKKSPHLYNGREWKNDLLSVIKPRNLAKVAQIFSDPQIGIIGSGNYIRNEYDPRLKKFNCTSDVFLRELIKKMHLSITDYSFVAGSIFMIRYNILKTFFSGEFHDIPGIVADLETGNSLDFFKGTYIHSWERMLSWTAISQGYKIYGI